MNRADFSLKDIFVAVVCLLAAFGAMQPACNAESFEDFLVEKARMPRPDAPEDPFEVLTHQDGEKAQWALRYLTRTPKETQQNLPRLINILRRAAEKVRKDPDRKFKHHQTKPEVILAEISYSIRKTPDLTLVEAMVQSIEPVIYDALEGKVPGIKENDALRIYFYAVTDSSCVIPPAIPSVERVISTVIKTLDDPDKEASFREKEYLRDLAYSMPERRMELLEHIRRLEGNLAYTEAKDAVEQRLRDSGEPISRELNLAISQENEEELVKGILSSEYGIARGYRWQRLSRLLPQSPNRLAITKRLLANPDFAREYADSFVPAPISEKASPEKKQQHDEIIALLTERIEEGEFWAMYAAALMVSSISISSVIYESPDPLIGKGVPPYALERVLDTLLKALVSANYEVSEKLGRVLARLANQEPEVAPKIQQAIQKKKEAIEKEFGRSMGTAFEGACLLYMPSWRCYGDKNRGGACKIGLY